MDEFTYHNLFDTKGIEYLVVIGFLLLLIPFWLILNRPFKATVKQVIGQLGFLTAGILRIPAGVFLSKNHMWAFLEKSGVARIGFDDFLVHITGDVNIRFLKEPGEKIRKGERIAEIEKAGKLLQVHSPISGQVLEWNQGFNAHKDAVIHNPYDHGWIYNIKPAYWLSETRSFHFAEEAVTWLRKEMDRYRDFLSLSVSRSSPGMQYALLQDGGEIADGSLNSLSEASWQEFQDEFLKI